MAASEERSNETRSKRSSKIVKITQRVKQKAFLWKVAIVKGPRNRALR